MQNGCMWRLNAQKRQSDGKWRISKVVEPHSCLINRGKENCHQLIARYLPRRILGFVDANCDVLVSYLIRSIYGFTGYEPKYRTAWHAKQHALEIHWGTWKEASNRVLRILCANVPLVYFHVVEVHLPSRVNRQFGRLQHFLLPVLSTNRSGTSK